MSVPKIPDMVDPMGKHWPQPDKSLIRLGFKYCHMPSKIFFELPEYSSTLPTGVYEGKMWKRHHYQGDGAWYLCWYDYSADPACVAIRQRRICFTDEFNPNEKG